MIRGVQGLRRVLGMDGQRAQLNDPGYGGLDAWVGYLRGVATAAGVSITPEKSLGISTVAAAVEIHSEAISRLPLVTYRRLKGGGKERATDHDYYQLLKCNPTEGLTAAEWRSLLQTDIETYGNAYALKIVIDGKIRELLPIAARRMEVKRTPSGEVEYKVSDEQGTRPVRNYSAGSILHLRGPFGTDLVASAPCYRYKELFGVAYVMERFIGASFKNGLRPSLAFSTDKDLTDKTRKNVLEWLQTEYAGSDKAGVAMLLEDGLKPVPFSQNFEQAQVAELDDKEGLKIARVYRVPPHMLGFNIAQPRANMEQQAREYIEMGLGSRVERWEQRLNLDLFDGGEGDFFCEFLYEDLLKGDPAVRAEFYNKLVAIGVMTRNEVRVRENLNPLPGLDEPLTPANMNRGNERRGAPAGAPPEEDEEDDEAAARAGSNGRHRL